MGLAQLLHGFLVKFCYAPIPDDNVITENSVLHKQTFGVRRACFSLSLVLEPSTCGSTLTLAKVGESTAREMGWMSLASLQKGAVLLSIPQGRRNGIHAERGASGILVTSRRRGDCGTDFRNVQGTNAKANAKKKLLDVYPVLTSNPSSSERSCCRNKGGWKSSASRQANDGFEPLTAKASRSKPGAFFSSKPVVPNLRKGNEILFAVQPAARLVV
ncbi:hypothetical protein VNO80_13021 [Phaseolus coccineus]|uniref:Uncharacterized protein n=1 Tax=Phaseolus coccineus TaxID=3886 RepID=A0AAN9R9N1_PHACN